MVLLIFLTLGDTELAACFLPAEEKEFRKAAAPVFCWSKEVSGWGVERECLPVHPTPFYPPVTQVYRLQASYTLYMMCWVSGL